MDELAEPIQDYKYKNVDKFKIDNEFINLIKTVLSDIARCKNFNLGSGKCSEAAQ